MFSKEPIPDGLKSPDELMWSPDQIPFNGEANKLTLPGWLQRVVSLPAFTIGRLFTVIFTESIFSQVLESTNE